MSRMAIQRALVERRRAARRGWAFGVGDFTEQAASDRAELRTMGERGRQLAARSFDRKLLAGQFVRWLEGVK